MPAPGVQVRKTGRRQPPGPIRSLGLLLLHPPFQRDIQPKLVSQSAEQQRQAQFPRPPGRRYTSGSADQIRMMPSRSISGAHRPNMAREARFLAACRGLSFS